MNGQGANKGVLFFIVVILLGALLGGVLGEILGLIVKGGVLHNILVTGINPSLGTSSNPVDLNLAVLQLTFSIGMKLNLLSVFGIVGAMWLFYKM